MGDFVLDQAGAAGASSTGGKQQPWWGNLARLNGPLPAVLVAAILAAEDGPPLGPAPLPVHAIPEAVPQKVRYLFTDIYGTLLAFLPLTGVTFSYHLNNPGSFSGTLHVEDPALTQTNWVEATQVNKTCVWVDVGGTLVWGGIVQGQNYDEVAQTVAVTATDFWGYMNQRLQAVDYATKWATVPAGAAEISYQIISDALAAANSLPISVALTGSTPSQYQVTFSAPFSIQQTIQSLVGQLQQLGWLVGFDIASDVAYVGGVPTGTINLSYPRRGRIAGSTGLMVTTANAKAFTYSVQGTSQANRVVEMSTSFGAVSQPYVWEPSMAVDGYPLLETLGMHTLFSATAEPQSVLNAWGANDLMLGAYPVVTPKLTQGLFDHPALGQWMVGDDVRLLIPKQSDLPPNPRFPDGLDFYFRIIQADVTISDEGLPLVAFTFNMPPSSIPPLPPL